MGAGDRGAGNSCRIEEIWTRHQGPKDKAEGYTAEMLPAKCLCQCLKYAACHKHLSFCGMENMWVMCAYIPISS